MSWERDAEGIAEGRWVKFTAGKPDRIIEFVGEPTKVKKESTIKGKEGEIYFMMSFPVLVDDEEKLLEPNKSLLTQLLAENKIEPIVGRSLRIICLDPPTNKNWMIRPVGTQQTATRQWSEPKPTPDRYEKPEARAIDQVNAQMDGDRGIKTAEPPAAPEAKKPRAKKAKKEAADVERQADNDNDS